MKAQNSTRYIDLFLCLVLLPAMIMLLPLDRWLDSDPKFVGLLLVWLYTVYALHRLFTVPMIFGSRRRIAIAMLLLGLTLVGTYLLSKYQLTQPPRPMPRIATEGAATAAGAARAAMREGMREGMPPMRSGGVSPMTHLQQQGVWFLYIIVTTLSVVVALLTELGRQLAVRQSMEFEKERAELSLYKAQINPHFLFNTLNTLLGLVIAKSDKAEDAVVQFTSLMRYMCNSSAEAQVPISTEIAYIEEYIALQRYRLSAHTKVHFENSVDHICQAYHIAPMLLITFVENALKYGASSQHPSAIEISTTFAKGEFRLTTRNAIFEGHTSEAGAGIGIANCRRRLELLYPKRHELKIEEREAEYLVDLRIKLL